MKPYQTPAGRKSLSAVLDVNIANPKPPSTPRTIEAIIDSGAEITLVPQEAIDELKLIPRDKADLRDFEGRTIRKDTPIYYCVIAIGEKSDIYKIASLSPGAPALLGMNVLYDYYTVLDGPNKQFEIQ